MEALYVNVKAFVKMLCLIESFQLLKQIYLELEKLSNFFNLSLLQNYFQYSGKGLKSFRLNEIEQIKLP